MSSRTSVCLALIVVFLAPLFSGCISAEDLPFIEQKGTPGGLTLACLDDSQYTSMIVEIDYSPGYQPETSSTDMLKQRLESVCDKPLGIKVVFTETDFMNENVWSPSDVRNAAWDTKSSPPMDNTILTWQFLFPSGVYEDESVLGVAVDASTVALFKDSIDDAENIFRRPSAEKIENSVLVHEAGHLLGLVNLVYTSPADHEDSAHPGHSNNEDSVMYWAVESASISNFFDNELPTEFDSDDIADLVGLSDGSISCLNQLWSP